MNAVKKRGGGRRRPPNDRLIGRTEVARLLQCNRSTVCRYEKEGLLKPALMEPDDVRWFDLKTVKALAVFALRRGTGAGRGGGPKGPARPAPEVKDEQYRPEDQTRRRPLAETPKRPAKIRAVPDPKPREAGKEAPTERGIGARTEIRSEWWNDDLTPFNPDKDLEPPKKE